MLGGGRHYGCLGLADTDEHLPEAIQRRAIRTRVTAPPALRFPYIAQCEVPLRQRCARLRANRRGKRFLAAYDAGPLTAQRRAQQQPGPVMRPATTLP